MNFRKLKSKIRRMGSALVVTLVMVVLVTIIAVAYLASVAIEGRSAKAFLDEQRAGEMANMGLHSAVARLRDGFGPWDNPFQNFTNNPPPFFWSISPGRLTRWDYTNVASQSNVALFSDPSLVPNTAVTTNLVNLNRRLADGSYPIIGGTNAPDLSVKWVNVLASPSQPADKTNQVIGRYAFWIDDENGKINLNTADGTQKTNRQLSPGVGTPGEVSLSSVVSNPTVASSIAKTASKGGFSTPRDLLQVTGMDTNTYLANVFNLTAYNRSPELNIFGEPRMFFIPAYRQALNTPYFQGTNGITQQPITEVYPTPSQLPGFVALYKTVKEGVISKPGATNSIPWNGALSVTSSRAWPIVFGQSSPKQDYANSGNFYQVNNGGYNYALIAKYLGGKNGLDKNIRWPSFPGTGQPSQGFLGKYNKRQLDSIALQICDLGYKAITPDDGSSEATSCNVPTATWGYLSDELVSGSGRMASPSEILVTVNGYPEIGTFGIDPEYLPPYVKMKVYIEWFLPVGFQGVDLLNCNPAATGITQSMGGWAYGLYSKPYLNAPDVPETLTPSPLTVKSLIPPYSFWQDTLLKSDAGLDFLANPGESYVTPAPDSEAKPAPDPDQTKAKDYHPYLVTASGSTYYGSGGSALAPILRMYSAGWGSSGAATYGSAQAWYPGQYWAMQNSNFDRSYLIKPGATSVTLSGGLTITGLATTGRGDPGPVPLEAKRGLPLGGGVNGTDENLSDPVVLDRVIKSVLPVNVTASIPGPEAGSSTHLQVADPLVNKFPGDWIVETSSTNTFGVLPNGNLAGASKGVSRYFNGANAAMLNHPDYDPDSYWMPEIDRNIPRSARMPSTGYLQYIRTGIVPDDNDDPAVDYAKKKGTPFRLLSFSPSTEAQYQKTGLATSEPYPDWALLDLFSVPSTIKPHGTFGGATSGRINPNAAVVYTVDVNTPKAGISRTVPLEAVFKGINVNENLTTVSGTPIRSGGQLVDEKALATAIETYVRANGPLRMPGEICNIPQVAALRPVVNRRRNDFVRQIVGELTTQSNVFSVWVVGQALRKKPSNSSYDRFEPDDNILAEVRYRFVVERYLDPGKDGRYGSTSKPGNDGIVGTWDDLMDVNDHPLAPRYLYRVVSAEEVR